MTETDNPTLAAAQACATATVAAMLGVAAGQTTYQLTRQMLEQQEGGALSIPLLGVEAAGIAAGFAAYLAVQATYQQKTQHTGQLWAEAVRRTQLP